MLDVKNVKNTKSKNKLYTKSYFVKRLEHAGYKVEPLPNIVFRNEERQWMIVVSPCYKNIVVVCHKRNPDDFYFHVIGKASIKVTTHSMDVVIEQLRLMHLEAPEIGVAT